jgi:hypothetical protein
MNVDAISTGVQAEGGGGPWRDLAMGESRGRLVTSIDLELLTRAGSLEHQRQLDHVAGRLLDALDRLQLPATIAVADPLHSAATDAILASPVGHELAVLGDATWVGRGAGRERFARELDRRCHGAKAAGLRVSSLVLRQAELGENFDLLARHAITAIRAPSLASAPLRQPHLLRLGTWQMPVTLALPCKPRWYQSVPSIVRKLLKHAAQAGEVVHLAIDAGQLAEHEPHKIVEIERILALAAQLRDSGHLEVRTLQSLAKALDPPHELAPLHSILRAA